jgi:mannose-6-phosphate isomerase-like protein (cupin superfamily)
MNLSNIYQATEWFEVLQTTNRSQTAVMRLGPGEHAEAHEDSEQLLLLVQGALSAEIGDEHLSMNMGDTVIVPAGIQHKFTNPGSTIAITFNVYCPPAYSPGEKG